nr:hypothetical protein [Tanacetum cinerariifolium]
MSVYIERKINEDLYFTAGLSHLWEVLYSRVNEHKLLIAELNVFGGPLTLQCAEFFKQLSQTEVLKMLEIRKSIVEVHMQVHKKIDILTVMSVGLRIAFDPTKSPHYKLVDAGRTFCDIDIQIYSSETRKWSLCNDFGSREFTINEMTIGCSVWMVRYRVHTDKFMTLFLEDDFGYREFTINEMTIGCSVWMVRYRVHTDEFMTLFLEGWLIRSNVWSIVLGEREHDSFLVIKLSGKVVQYNLISKTLHEIYDCGSNQVDDNHDDNDDDELLR